MKISALLLLPSLAHAFSIAPSTRPIQLPSRSAGILRESAVATQETSVASVYDQIGIEKDELAMGVDPEEVYKWIGTRAAMVEKAMQDCGFDRDRAELEVGKYLLDPEAMNYHIEFKKRLAETPDMIQPEEKEGIFSFRTFVIVYITYIFGEILYKNTPLHDKVDLDWVPGWGPKVVEAAADAAQQASDAAASISVDTLQSAIDTATAIGNSM